MTDSPASPTAAQELRVENALLRAALWLTARALKDYHDAPHRKSEDEDGTPMLQVIVPASLRGKAAALLARAEKHLREPGSGREP